MTGFGDTRIGMRSRAEVLRHVEDMEEVASRLRAVHVRRLALGAEPNPEIEKQIQRSTERQT
jgi:hypothetical protein